MLVTTQDDNDKRVSAHQNCKKLVAITSSSSKSSSLGMAFLLAPWEFVRFDNGAGFEGRAWAGNGLLEWLEGCRVWCVAIERGGKDGEF